MMDSLQVPAEATNVRLMQLFQEWESQPLEPIFGTRLGTALFEEVRSLTLRGGKRVRAALLVHAGGLFESEPLRRKAVLDVACALELLQAYFLIHDDVMDEDDIRRGGPAVHAALGARFGSARLGQSLGILAGDLAISLVQWVVAQLDVGEAVRQKVARLMASMQADVIHGQMLDVIGHRSPEEVALHKTASYTTVGPLCLGATLCGADDTAVAHLAVLGRDLGVAFQLQDDLIGALGDPATTGKPVGSDLRSGKRTFLLQEALACADSERRNDIEAVLGRGDAASEPEVRKAIVALRSCGAVERVAGRVDDLVRSFCAGLLTRDYLPQAVSNLMELARFVAERSA